MHSDVERPVDPADSAAAVRFVVSSWVGFTLQFASLIVLLPFHLEALGFGVDDTAAVVAAAGVGGILSAEPVGRLARMLGPVRMVRLGVAAGSASVLAIGLTSSFALMLLLHGVIGVCTALIRVGCQMVVRERVTDDRRGRVHGLQGLMTRIVMLAVPILIGAMWERFDAEVNFVVPALIGLVALVVAGGLPVRMPEGGRKRPGDAPALSEMIRYSAGPILFVAARAGRMLLLPLIGLELDLSASRIGLLVGLSAAADVLVSPLSGPIMDSRGRLATIVPAFSLMAAGFVILGLSTGGWGLVIAAIVLGIGNGFSSGLILTLGTDLAPAGNAGPFLGRFGALNDVGRLVGPFLVGLLGERFGLGEAAISLAIVTLLALGLVYVFIGETRPATTV